MEGNQIRQKKNHFILLFTHCLFSKLQKYTSRETFKTDATIFLTMKELGKETDIFCKCGFITLNIYLLFDFM